MGEDAEDRWEAARRLLADAPDDGLPARRARWVWFVVLLMLLCFAAGSAAAAMLPEAPRRSASSWAQLTVQGALTVVGIAALITATAWGRRTGRLVSPWRQVASPLHRAERRNAYRQIWGKRPPDERHLPVLVGMAHEHRRTVQVQIPMQSAVVLFVLAQLVGNPEPWLRWVFVTAGALVLGGALVMTVQYRRAGRFIGDYG